MTYAEMGRFQSAESPSDPKGTNDEAAAAKDAKGGQPISKGARDIWVTETALTTALNMGFMSEMLSIFSIIVGVALLLTGIGLVILAFAVFGRGEPGERADRRLAGRFGRYSVPAPFEHGCEDDRELEEQQEWNDFERE